MSKYYGNIVEDATIELTFNTFNSDGASVTVTDLSVGDIKIHKDGNATERSSNAGITLIIDYDGITGNHLIAIDTSDNTDTGFYAVGSNYEVRVEGITVDTQTINAFIGSFSVDNRAADATKISGDSTAADNLESQYDTTGLSGDTFPSTQSQIGNLSTGSAAISTTATGTATSIPTVIGTPTNTYESTIEADEVYHSWTDTGNVIEFAYDFNIGPNASPVEFSWTGYAQGNNDEIGVYARKWAATATWQRVGTITGTQLSTVQSATFSLTTAHVDTGDNSGNVRIRFQSSDVVAFATDRCLLSYTMTNQSVGYANGAIWVNTNCSNENTVDYVDGTADNPVSTWAAALTLSASLGIDRFQIINGSAITLSDVSDNFTLLGFGWTLALGGRSIEGAYFEGAIVSGTGVATASSPKFKECRLAEVTLPPCGCQTCGFGVGGAAFTASSAGQYSFVDCFSLVPGSGAPSLTFTGTGATTGINVRRWAGGATYTLDNDCVLSHEVLVGGCTTVITGGADVDIRGITRSLVITASATETVQFVGTTGTVTLNGTTTATFNLYGIACGITDNTSAGVINDCTVSRDNIPDDVWDETLSASDHNIANSAGRRLRQLTVQVLLDGTSPGGNTSTTLNLDTDADTISRIYDPGNLWIYEGTGAGQSRQIFEYDGPNRTCYVNRDWVIIPDSTSKYILTASSGDTHVNEGKAQGNGGGLNTIQLNTLAETTDDVYIGQTIFIVAGLGADQSSPVTDYVGSTKTATVEHNWPITPDSTSIYAMLPTITHSIAETQAGLAIETKQDSIIATLGTVPAIDGAEQTVGAAIGKIVDDNGGSDFDATTDSLEKISGSISSGGGTPQIK